jgi:XTP/dITP diphosphohydrolase
MRILYATKNKGKIEALEKDLRGFDAEVVSIPLEMPEPRSNDVREIAEQKIIYAYKHLKKPVVVMDAGFYIHSLNGFPRAFVNFALETIGIEGLLKLAEGKKDRACEFRECLAYMDGKLKKPEYFVTKIPGKLATKPRGTMARHLWSKLGLIYIPPNHTKTLGEMGRKEYIKWHFTEERSSAGVLLREWLVKNRTMKKL